MASGHSELGGPERLGVPRHGSEPPLRASPPAETRCADWVSSERLWPGTAGTARAALLARGVAALAFTAFSAYFAFACFWQRWGSDLQLYCAVMRRLFDHLSDPGHEAVVAPTAQSFAYSPYLVALGAVGKALAVTPYRALQLAGCLNVVLLAGATLLFCARHSVLRRWEASAVGTLFAMFFVRWDHFGWSSELDPVSLSYNQAYPSTMGWVLALLSFSLMKDLGHTRWLRQLALALSLGLLTVTHALTAGWSLGIVGLYGLTLSVVQRRTAPLARAAVVLLVAVGLGLSWGYTPLLGQSNLTAVVEGSRFGQAPLLESWNLYALGAVSGAFLLVGLRRHAFWVLSCVVTLVMLQVWRAIGAEYGNRFAFFAMFFPQFLVGEVVGIALLQTFEESGSDRVGRLQGALARWLPSAVTFLALAAWPKSPMWASGKVWNLVGPLAAAAQPSAHDAYQARFASLVPQLSSTDVVMIPNIREIFDLATLSGAHFVAAYHMVRVPDRPEREQDVRRFFDAGTPNSERASIVARRQVTKVLLPRWLFNLTEDLSQALGAPIYQDADWAVFQVPAATGVGA